MKLKNDGLTATIQYTLSRPPAAAGRRLKSERELATMLGVGESKVRKSLESLVKEGVLVRRRGSGTFVRRIADPPPVIPTDPVMEDVVQGLFSDDSIAIMETHTARLHLGLWGDLESHDSIHQSILSSISRAVSARGHRFSVHSCVQDWETNKPIPVHELAEQLKANPCDGYIVVHDYAETFLKAIGDRNVPVVYFRAGTTPVRHEPLIMMHTNEAIERAVYKFADQGLEKIALIAQRRHKTPEPEQRAYENVMQFLGLPYRKSILCDIGVVPAMNAVRGMIKSGDIPEAVYVADDNVLLGVSEALSIEGLKPGKDIAVITLSNRSFPLPSGFTWSRFEFDRERFGQLIIDDLLNLLQSAGAKSSTVSLHGKWIEGETHFMKKSKFGVFNSA